MGVADKKGQRHLIKRTRTISTNFGSASVVAYNTMLSSLLSTKMENLAAGSARAGNGIVPAVAGESMQAGEGINSAGSVGKRDMLGIISYSEELCRNCVRSGVPPPLPKYTRVAMWRGEDVCLEQLGVADMNELIVGITWCEPKDGKTGKVDLDLSVMVREKILSFLFIEFLCFEVFAESIGHVFCLSCLAYCLCCCISCYFFLSQMTFYIWVVWCLKLNACTMFAALM